MPSTLREEVELFTAETAPSVSAGDIVHIDPKWNKSCGDRRMHFPDAVRVLETKREIAETGIVFRVAYNDGRHAWLSAGWFAPTNGIA